MIVEGRLIARERLVKATNQKVTFYSIHALNSKGVPYWAQVNFTKDVDMKKIQIPGLVRIDVYTSKLKTTSVDSGETYVNKIFGANSCVQVESLPAFEEVEQKLLKEKIDA